MVEYPEKFLKITTNGPKPEKMVTEKVIFIRPPILKKLLSISGH